jgi:cytochrome c biogenesis protein CcdA
VTLELASLPLAWFAGIVSVLSPCVWPLVPVVMSSAATGGRAGPYFLAMGLATAFGVAGTFLTLLLLNLGLDPELFRYVAASLLIAVAIPLLVQQAGDWLTLRLSALKPSAGAPWIICSTVSRANAQMMASSWASAMWSRGAPSPRSPMATGCRFLRAVTNSPAPW